ncbi:fiber 1 [Aviadenovirus phalacrocoracidae]|uniref:Fiber 1 n=1 Tax=Aviadenovirus sp. TaxID=2217649 RepID=A0ABZ0T483_9ADEN|nr:fiber 1 [Aviadenovirus sp.]
MKRVLLSALTEFEGGKPEQPLGNRSSPPKRRMRTGETVDLLYPFTRSTGTGTTTLTAPISRSPFSLDPDGPLVLHDNSLSVNVRTPLVNSRKRIALQYDGNTLYQNNGMLSVKTDPKDGITVGPDGLALKLGNGLEKTESGLVGVKIDFEGPVNVSEDGINVKINDTLEVDQDWELGVRLNDEEPIGYNGFGLTLRVDDTLLVERNPDTKMHELGVHLNERGPLTADQDGVDLEWDTDSLRVTSDPSPKLAVKLNPTGPIVSDESGLTLGVDTDCLKIDNGKKLSVRLKDDGCLSKSRGNGIDVSLDATSMEVTGDKKLSVRLKDGGCLMKSAQGVELSMDETSMQLTNDKKLSVRLKEDGCLSKSENGGIELALDDSTMAVVDKKLTLKKGALVRSYLSPYCVLIGGNPNLNDYKGLAKSQANVDWRVSYYLYMVNCCGIVNAQIVLYMDKAAIEKMGEGSPGQMAFTFVVNLTPRDMNTNHSNMTKPEVLPSDDSTYEMFVPSMDQYAKGLPLIPWAGGNWYCDADTSPGVSVTYQPYHGNTYTWGTSVYRYFLAKIHTGLFSPFLVMCFKNKLNPESQNWYTEDKRGNFLTGPLPFSYHAVTPEVKITQ